MSKTAIVKVELSKNSYPILIGEGLLQDLKQWLKFIKSQQVMIVTNPKVGALYLNPLCSALIREGKKTDIVEVMDGEQNKNHNNLELIYSALIKNKHEKATTLLALGGGVIGDMTGFAAATYQRGVAFIQIPTTLLAQVDASIGGKTAINHPLGKNMIGAIYQPQCVISDISTLTTLPQREYNSGLAEVIKYALIHDESFFSWLEANTEALLQHQKDVLLTTIQRCAEIKANYVSQDEFEKGVRVFLNFGHTFGHAIESATQYKTFLHGEAVAIGMVLAAELSMLSGLISETDFNRIVDVLAKLGLPTKIPSNLESHNLLELMSHDKKVAAGKIRLILLEKMGKAFITSDYDSSLMQRVMAPH